MNERARYYRLIDQEVVPLHGDDAVMTWAMTFGSKAHRVIKQEWIGGQFISTVFLGLDHSYSDEGPPLVFETMIFHGPHNQEYQERASSYAEALVMHAEAVALLLSEMTLWRRAFARVLRSWHLGPGRRIERYLMSLRMRRMRGFLERQQMKGARNE